MDEEKKSFDAHFSLNGFWKIEARNAEEAAEIAELTYGAMIPHIELTLGTGVGLEIHEVVEAEEPERVASSCPECGFDGDDKPVFAKLYDIIDVGEMEATIVCPDCGQRWKEEE